MITKESNAWLLLSEVLAKRIDEGLVHSAFLCNWLKDPVSQGAPELLRIEPTTRRKMAERLTEDVSVLFQSLMSDDRNSLTATGAGSTYGTAQNNFDRAFVCRFFALEAAEKEKPVYLTAAKLRELDACDTDYRGFRRLFGHRAAVTVENVKLAAEKDLDTSWLAGVLDLPFWTRLGCTCDYHRANITEVRYEAYTAALREALTK